MMMNLPIITFPLLVFVVFVVIDCDDESSRGNQKTRMQKLKVTAVAWTADV